MDILAPKLACPALCNGQNALSRDEDITFIRKTALGYAHLRFVYLFNQTPIKKSSNPIMADQKILCSQFVEFGFSVEIQSKQTEFDSSDDELRKESFHSLPDGNLIWSIVIKPPKRRKSFEVGVYLEKTKCESEIIEFLDISATIFREGSDPKSPIKIYNAPLSRDRFSLGTMNTMDTVGYFDYENFVINCNIKYYFKEINARSLTAKLFNDLKFTDATISVDGEELRAHKAVLAAQSPIFEAAFSHNTIEANSNRIEIIDFDSHTIRTMLQVIYTGEFAFRSGANYEEREEDLKIVSELLRAADKYQVEVLKPICERFLRKYINLDFVTEVYNLAGIYNYGDLETRATNFMWKNLGSLIETKKWKECFGSNKDLELKFHKQLIKTIANEPQPSDEML